MKREIYKIDAAGQSVGRLASQIAVILRGKNKVNYEPRINSQDIVEVVNVNKLKFTGKKIEQKKFYRYSGYPGGLKTIKINELFQKNPQIILIKAIKQMLPANKTRNIILKRLIIK